MDDTKEGKEDADRRVVVDEDGLTVSEYEVRGDTVWAFEHEGSDDTVTVGPHNLNPNGDPVEGATHVNTDDQLARDDRLLVTMVTGGSPMKTWFHDVPASPDAEGVTAADRESVETELVDRGLVAADRVVGPAIETKIEDAEERPTKALRYAQEELGDGEYLADPDGEGERLRVHDAGTSPGVSDHLRSESLVARLEGLLGGGRSGRAVVVETPETAVGWGAGVGAATVQDALEREESEGVAERVTATVGPDADVVRAGVDAASRPDERQTGEAGRTDR